MIGEAIVGARLSATISPRSATWSVDAPPPARRRSTQARPLAVNDRIQTAASLGANAVIGVDIDDEALTRRGSMLPVSITYTAVNVGAGIRTDAVLHAYRAVNAPNGTL